MKKVPFDFVPAGTPSPDQRKADFEEFEAIELYCPKCSRATSVRKSLLLVLPDGDKYEYRCENCGSTVGEKMDRNGQYYGILKT